MLFRRFLVLVVVSSLMIFVPVARAAGPDKTQVNEAIATINRAFPDAKIVRGRTPNASQVEEEKQALVDAAEYAKSLTRLVLTNHDNRFQHKTFSVALNGSFTPIGLRNLLEHVGQTIARDPGMSGLSVEFNPVFGQTRPVYENGRPTKRDEDIPIIMVSGDDETESAQMLGALTDALASRNAIARLSVKANVYYWIW